MSPTFERLPSFQRDFAELTPEQRKRFVVAVADLVADLKAGHSFRPGLRVKRVQGTRDVWEMTWAPNGRATWQYGGEVIADEPHVVWRHVGTHDIFRNP